MLADQPIQFCPEAHFISGPSSMNFSLSQFPKESPGQYSNHQPRPYKGRGGNRGRVEGDSILNFLTQLVRSV
jgi:hypothetical protein